MRGQCPGELSGSIGAVSRSLPRHRLCAYNRTSFFCCGSATAECARKQTQSWRCYGGGGVVGCEFACLFAALGIPVTLIHSQSHLFPFVDHEISQLLQQAMQAMGV